MEMTEHKKKWHPVRDATKSVIWKIRLLFQSETDAFHCFTNGGVVNVVARYCSDATLQINGDRFHAIDGADALFGVGATVVAGHAFHCVGAGLMGMVSLRLFFRLTTAGLIMAMTMVAMVVPAAAC